MEEKINRLMGMIKDNERIDKEIRQANGDLVDAANKLKEENLLLKKEQIKLMNSELQLTRNFNLENVKRIELQTEIGILKRGMVEKKVQPQKDDEENKTLLVRIEMLKKKILRLEDEIEKTDEAASTHYKIRKEKELLLKEANLLIEKNEQEIQNKNKKIEENIEAIAKLNDTTKNVKKNKCC